MQNHTGTKAKPMTKQAATVTEPEAPAKRAEETRAKRRRRADTSYEGAHRLSVNHELLDHNKFAYRFVNDVGDRILDKTVRDDWDKVPDPDAKDDSDGLGAPIRKVVGRNVDGSPLHSYLLRKPKEYFDEDAKKKTLRRDELDAAIKRGQHTAPPAQGADQSNTYTPSGGISIAAKTGNSQNYNP